MNDHSTLTRQQLIEEVKRLKNHAAGLELALAEKTCAEESRHQYEFIVNTSRELLSLVDSNYRYVAINDAYCSAHQRSRQEIIGKSVVDIWGAEVFECTIRGNLARCFAGEEVNYQALFELPAVGTRSMDVTYYPYRNSDDQVTHVVVMSRDITEKNAVEHELVALKKAVETMQLGVTISSCDGKILYTNPAEAAMHGYSPEELIGMKANVFSPHVVKNLAPPIDICKISSWRREGVNVDRHGKNFPVHLMSDVVRDQDGEPIAIVTTCENITGRKIIEQKLKRQVERVTTLRELDMMILSNLEVRELLSRFLSQFVDRLAIDAAAIRLRSQHTLMLESAVVCGFRSQSYQHEQIKLGDGLAGTVAYERTTLLVPDICALDGASVAQCLVADEGFRFYCGVPLIAKGAVIGTLEVFHRAPLEPDGDWIDFLNVLAGQAAVAIDYTSMFRDLQHSRDELMFAYDTTIEGWSRALDYRDKETEGHSRRVTELTVKIAQFMGIDDSDIVHFRRGALLHDIGKLGVPDCILFKPGRLTDEEWQIMKKHPKIAFELLAPIAFLRPSVNIPYCHHEKWDGSGYPNGLCGEQIPLEARIFSIVDAWDALSNDRYYRTAWPMEKVHSHIRELSGTHFDPNVVKAFLQGMDQREREEDTMKTKSHWTQKLMIVVVVATMSLMINGYAAAHCDTLDGPVVLDARKALENKDVTPVLKWVQAKDEKSVKDSFKKALAAQGKKQQQAVENKFFESLVRVHRAGEGAPFTGLKPAGEALPVIAEADKALTGGTPDGLIKMVTDTVNQGIRQRYEKVMEALKHKNESVQKGREYVAAYVGYTHYVERLQMDAQGHAAHHGEPAKKKHATAIHEHGHK